MILQAVMEDWNPAGSTKQVTVPGPDLIVRIHRPHVEVILDAPRRVQRIDAMDRWVPMGTGGRWSEARFLADASGSRLRDDVTPGIAACLDWFGLEPLFSHYWASRNAQALIDLYEQALAERQAA